MEDKAYALLGAHPEQRASYGWRFGARCITSTNAITFGLVLLNLACSIVLLSGSRDPDILSLPSAVLLSSSVFATSFLFMKRRWGDPAPRASAGLAVAGLLLASSVILACYPLLRIPLLGRAGDYRGVFLVWLTSAAAYLAAFVLPARAMSFGAYRDHIWNKAVAAGLGGCIAVAALARLVDLGTVPYVFQGDEGAFALWAQGLSFRPMSNPFETGFLSQPTLGIFVTTSSLRLLGASVEGARIPWALFGIATIPVAFALGKAIRGAATGLVTAALVSVYHFHIHYSRTALNNIADPLLLSLSLLCLIRAIERRSLFAWAMVGSCCGLALYFYQGARLTVVVVAAVAAYTAIRQAGEERRWTFRGMLVAAGGFGVTAAPMLQFAIRSPNDFNARVNQVSIFRPGWLFNEAIVTGDSVLWILWTQFYRAFLAFTAFADTSAHYSLPSPLLDPFFGMLFLVALLITTGKALYSKQDWRLLTVVAWWWAGTIVGGAMTFSPPASQRLVTLSVPVCFFIALAIEQVALWLRRRWFFPAAMTQAVATAAFAAISLKTYFLDFVPLHRSGGAPAAVMMELLPVVKAADFRGSVLFFGAPHILWGFPTMAFLGSDVRGRDVLEPLKAPPPSNTIAEGETSMFIFLPDRLGELDLVRQTFPAGEISKVRSPVDQRVVATIYKVTR